MRVCMRALLCGGLAGVWLWAQPAPISGFKDEGVFLLFKDEERVGVSKFRWLPDGTFSSEMTISVAGQSVVTSTSVVVDAQGRWVKLEAKSPVGVVTAVREGDQLRRTFKEKTTTETVKPGARLFDNYGPALMSQAVRLYDRGKGGKQGFQVFVVPGAPLEASLEYKDQLERSVGGRDMQFSRFVYSLAGIDLILWVDAGARIYLADVPQQHAAFVREGYEILRQAPAADPLLSAAKFEVKVQSGVGVPMRDKLKLATDLYLPAGEGKFPVILVRTPYKKEMVELQARYYARRGYAVAVQDCRGRFASPGAWEPFVNEARDGYDTIEWLARQPWSSGKVGMIGGSYLGWVQWQAARERPPHLVTIIPNVAPPDPFYNFPYEYGVFFMLGGIWWADIQDSNATADLGGVVLSRIMEKKYMKLLAPLPVIDLDKAVLGRESPSWRRWIQHPTNDAYWAQASFLERLKNVRLPAFHQSGWFDGDGIGSKLNYLGMKRHGHPNQKLILGPWGHTDTASRRLGDRDFGAQALLDLQRDYLRWFDYWLKGLDNGILKEPLVKIFAMGSNQWLEGDVYPLPYTRFEKWYLASGGQANTSKGDGRLTPQPAPADAPPDRYTYDPGDPTPAPSYYEETEEEEKIVRSADEKKKIREAYREKVTQARRDILVYVTEPFKEPFTFAGPISAVLYAASSARDTDWFLTLVEVDKEGKHFPLGAAKLRARFRRSLSKPELLKPGQVYEYQLDLWQTGITIPAGHRLRVEVASAYFPLFSRNLNTGGHNEIETKFVKAEQTIYHDARYPSHLLLPVIPAERLKK